MTCKTSSKRLIARGAAALVLLCAGVRAWGGAPSSVDVAPTTNVSRLNGPYARELSEECESLLAESVRRPYGRGWAGAATTRPTEAEMPVSMRPGDTPAAAVLLLWSGRLLGDAHFVEASRQAARGMAASIEPTGRLTSEPIFRVMHAGGREAPAEVADRSTTCAGMALAIAEIDDISREPPADVAAEEALAEERLMHSSGWRMAHWLVAQQTPSGAWPGLSPKGPVKDPQRLAVYGAAGQEVDRAIRLDQNGYRDGTLALLLAAEGMKDQGLSGQARRPLEALLRTRIAMGAMDGGLFQGILALSGDGRALNGFSAGPDVLATRYAMQTLLAGYVVLGDMRYQQALFDAATALDDRRRNDGMWDRYPARPQSSAIAATTQASTEPALMPTTEPANLLEPGKFGLPGVLDATGRLKLLGRDRFVTSLATPVDAHRQMIAVLLGFSDDPLTMDLPPDKDQVASWLASHDAMFAPLRGPTPASLSEQTRRLWLLYLRAALEQEAGSAAH